MSRGSLKTLEVWKKKLLRIGGGGIIVQSKGCSENLFSLDTAVVALE